MRFVLLAFVITAPAFADCQTGWTVVDNGLAFTVPPGYCAEDGTVRDIETHAPVLTFGKSVAACPGDVVASAGDANLRYGTKSGVLWQRSRRSAGCRDAVWFARMRDDSDSPPLLALRYHDLPPEVAKRMDALIDGVTAAVRPMMKGMELYSWREGGAWRFSLLGGTNRLKSDDEVMAPSVTIQSIDELKTRLGALPPQEWVTLETPRHAPFAEPPANVIDDLIAFCESREILLHVTGRETIGN